MPRKSRAPEFPASVLLDRAIELAGDRSQGPTFESVARELDALASTLASQRPDAAWAAAVEAGRLRAAMWTAQRLGRFDDAERLFRARRALMDRGDVGLGVSVLQERVSDQLAFAAYAYAARRTEVADELCRSAEEAVRAVLDGRTADAASPAALRALLDDVAGVRARRGTSP